MKDENTLYLLKFNNENILKDECGNKWSIDLDEIGNNNLPYLSDDGIIYPAINFSGSNYIESDISKFNILSNWTIDFWLYLEENNPYLTYLSIKGDNLIISNRNVSIKTDDYKFQKININIPLHKWVHFALTKYGNYISIHINGNMYTFIRLPSFICTKGNINIITLGKSIKSMNCDCPYKLMHFRISNISRFKINKSFDPLSTLAFINKTKVNSLINIKQKFYILKRQISYITTNNTNTYNNTLITCKNKVNTQRNIKCRYYKLAYSTERKIEGQLMSGESYDFLSTLQIINDNCLYLLKFNNENILKDECGNKWNIGQDSTIPYLSDDGIIYPAINFSGSNYIETSAKNFIINSNWTIDFWLYLEKNNEKLTYASIKGNNIIIENKNIYIKLINNEYSVISNINIPLHKWVHFALTKYGNYISIHINGNMYTFIRLPSFICVDSDLDIITLGKSIKSMNCDCPYKLMHFRISNISRFKINKSFDPLSALAFINKTKVNSLINIKQKFYILKRQIYYITTNNTNTYNNTLITCKNKVNTQRDIKCRYYKLAYSTERKIEKQIINSESYFIFSNGPINVNYSARFIIKTFTQVLANTIVYYKISNYHEYHRYYLDENLTTEEIRTRDFLLNIKIKYDLKRIIKKNENNKIIRQVVLQKRDYDENYEFDKDKIIPYIINIKEKINLQRFIIKNIKLINLIKKSNTDYINDNYYYYDPLPISPFISYFKYKFNLIRKVNKYNKNIEIEEKDNKTKYDDNYEYYDDDNNLLNYFIKVKFNLKRNVNINIKTITISSQSYYDYNSNFEYSPLPIYSIFTKKICIKNNIKRIITTDNISYNKYSKYKIRLSNYDIRYSYNPISKISSLLYYKQKNSTTRIINNITYNQNNNQNIHSIKETDYDKKYEYKPILNSHINIRVKLNTTRIVNNDTINKNIIFIIRKINCNNKYKYYLLLNSHINIKIKLNTTRIVNNDIIQSTTPRSIKETDYDREYEYSPLSSPYINIRVKLNTKRIINNNNAIFNLIKKENTNSILEKNITINLKNHCVRIICNVNSSNFKYFLTPELVEYYTNYKNNFNINY